MTDPITEARKALAAAGLPEAADSRVGSTSPAGYQVTPLLALGPARAAVRWRPSGSSGCTPGPELARCREALDAAGCRSHIVVAPGGGFLAVLASAVPAGGDAQ